MCAGDGTPQGGSTRRSKRTINRRIAPHIDGGHFRGLDFFSPYSPLTQNNRSSDRTQVSDNRDENGPLDAI